MNKKFFTLLVAFLATISMGAFAQSAISVVDVANNQPYGDKAYLLKTAEGKFLAVENGNLVVKDNVATTLADLKNMQWTVKTTAGSSAGVVPTYQYTNVGSEHKLSLYKDRAVNYHKAGTATPKNELGGDIDLWNTDKENPKTSTNFFYVTIEADSVITMSVTNAGDVVPYAYKNYETLEGVARAYGAATVSGLQAIASAQKAVADAVKLAVPETGLNPQMEPDRLTLLANREKVQDAATVIKEAAIMVNLNTDALAAAFIADGAGYTDFMGGVAGSDRFAKSITYTRNLADQIIALNVQIADLNPVTPITPSDDILTLTPKLVKGNIGLSANDMNTYLGKVGVKNEYGLWATEDSRFNLDYSPKKITIDTPLSKGGFQAIGVANNNSVIGNGYNVTSSPWMFLNTGKDAKGNNLYLVVDTVYTYGTSQDNNGRLQFNTAKLAEAEYDAEDNKNPRLLDSYVFAFFYDAATGKIYGVSKKYVEKDKGVVTDTYTWGEQGQFNVISLAELGDETKPQYTSAATVGADTLWFKLDAEATYTPITLTPGAYLMKVVGTAYPEAYRKGKYKVRNLCGDIEYVTYDPAVQELQHIPSAQWIVLSKNDKTASIVNREYEYRGDDSYQTTYGVKDADGKLVANQFFTLNNDTIQLIPVTNAMDKKLGYFYDDEADGSIDSYTFRFLHALGMDLPINITEDSVLVINKDNEPLYLRIYDWAKTTWTPGLDKYGWGHNDENVLKDKVARLERHVYSIGLYETIDREGKPSAWVAYDYDSKRFVINKKYGNNYCDFYFKEYYHVGEGEEAAEYYVLVGAYESSIGRVAVDERSLELVNSEICNESDETVNIATFKIEKRSDILYRTVTDKDDKAALEQNIRLYRVKASEKEYLYEDANSVYSTPVNGENDDTRKGQINFLGFQGKGDNDEYNTVFTARYVRGEKMPQYMLFVDKGEKTTETIIPCPICEKEGLTEGCIHDEKEVITTTSARMLVNFVDSAETKAGVFNGVKEAYKYQSYTRLGFIDVNISEKDSMLIWPNAPKLEKTDKGTRYIYNDTKEDYKYYAHKDYSHTNYLFSFRLIDKESDDFLIESVGTQVGTVDGRWIQKLNGVPVLTSWTSFYDPNSQAEIFNWDLTDLDAVSNEGPAAGVVEVTAAYGTVTVTGAAGQAVVITDVLGKTIANTVINSDAATFAAPAGVAIVKVAGEATKVLVK